MCRRRRREVRGGERPFDDLGDRRQRRGRKAGPRQIRERVHGRQAHRILLETPALHDIEQCVHTRTIAVDRSDQRAHRESANFAFGVTEEAREAGPCALEREKPRPREPLGLALECRHAFEMALGFLVTQVVRQVREAGHADDPLLVPRRCDPPFERVATHFVLRHVAKKEPAPGAPRRSVRPGIERGAPVLGREPEQPSSAAPPFGERGIGPAHHVREPFGAEAVRDIRELNPCERSRGMRPDEGVLVALAQEIHGLVRKALHELVPDRGGHRLARPREARHGREHLRRSAPRRDGEDRQNAGARTRIELRRCRAIDFARGDFGMMLRKAHPSDPARVLTEPIHLTNHQLPRGERQQVDVPRIVEHTGHLEKGSDRTPASATMKHREKPTAGIP